MHGIIFTFDNNSVMYSSIYSECRHRNMLVIVIYILDTIWKKKHKMD